MSFAEEMGHDIPSYEDYGRSSEDYSYSRYNAHKTNRGLHSVEVDITTVVHETEKAYLVHLRGADIDVWIPKSQGSINESKTMLTIPQWLVDAIEDKLES